MVPDSSIKCPWMPDPPLDIRPHKINNKPQGFPGAPVHRVFTVFDPIIKISYVLTEDRHPARTYTTIRNSCDKPATYNNE